MLRSKVEHTPTFCSYVTNCSKLSFTALLCTTSAGQEEERKGASVMSDPENSLAELQAAAFRHVDRVVGEGGHQLESIPLRCVRVLSC